MSAALVTMLVLKPEVDVVPATASFAVISIVLGVIRGNFFSVMDSAREWVLDHSDNPLVIVDAKGRFLDANDAALEVFGELKGLKIRRRLPVRVAALFGDAETGEATAAVKYDDSQGENATVKPVDGNMIELAGKYYTRQVAQITQTRQVAQIMQIGQAVWEMMLPCRSSMG